MPDRFDAIRQTLATYGQEHVLRFADELPSGRRAALVDQIGRIDFAFLAELIRTLVTEPPPPVVPGGIAPARYFSPRAAADGGARPFDAARARAAGEDVVRRGCLAAFTVAGGQGTRLGWNGPKGTYPATPVTGKPLFRIFAEQILAAQKKYGATIPWYIMTSPENDAATRAFFVDNNCFGLVRNEVFMFPQGVMPTVDAVSGRVLLSARDAVAVSPDGHGGAIRALRTSAAIEDMRSRGIEEISYFQVDNPLCRVVDPVFIGLHAAGDDSSGEMSSKMIAKTLPEEKVGVMVRAAGRTRVIEYSDLPPEVAAERDASGGLRYRAGNPAIHLLSVAFVERLTEDEHRSALPYHRALKKVAFIDVETGNLVEPAEPNAVKLETFVFDALPLAASSIVYETDRVEEFAPIKNASGADSPASSHQIQSERAARWLEAHGVSVPRDDEGRLLARIEISPLAALEPADLVAVDLPESIGSGEEVAF